VLHYLAKEEEFCAAFTSAANGDDNVQSVVNLRFSGDGRRTTKKLGSVMTTFCLPSENLIERSPDKEYCISIYDGKFDTI